ncbi:MAG: hypothetical protein ACJARX_000701 [Psychroserpens sp.]|jgi:hypothetical protein
MSELVRQIQECGDLHCKISKKNNMDSFFYDFLNDYFKKLGISQTGIATILCIFERLYLVNI